MPAYKNKGNGSWYVPVVEKEIKWTRRCKDPSLVGKVKERITQVSMSKKWESQPVLGVDGEPLKTKTGKAILKQSYSVLQDDFFEYMRAAGYTDVERGERGSSEEHLCSWHLTKHPISRALCSV